MEEYIGRTELAREGLSNGSLDLRISGLRPSDDGQYVCTVQDAASYGEATVDLEAADIAFAFQRNKLHGWSNELHYWSNKLQHWSNKLHYWSGKSFCFLRIQVKLTAMLVVEGLSILGTIQAAAAFLALTLGEAFIEEMMGNTTVAWTGLRIHQGKETEWTWGDRSPLQKILSPVVGPKEDNACGAIGRGRLNSHICSTPLHWICQREATEI
ncbi:butyrophilin subfamily 3 member a2-like isoform x1 [Limosa lapponica baueri]|uniref:Butyrophilin subfamily 3 member a2-like isoform x1 n=1 Tax=Limosa lapponica baueri TaxID=1758121 RepID=A0A2I0TE86_LIMLA|nr:butyrophilin subfamily 3 member a2-like isoform x1 [Limosa lapponica baueri]